MEQIKQMEVVLSQQQVLVERVNQVLQELEDSQQANKDLLDYYVGEQYLLDMEAVHRGEMEAAPGGLFSEDAVFDLLTDQHQLAIRLLEIGTALLRRESDG